MASLSSSSPSTFQIEDLVKRRCQFGNLDIEDARHLFDKMLGANPKPSFLLLDLLPTRILRMKNTSHYPTILSLYNNMNWAAGVSPHVSTSMVSSSTGLHPHEPCRSRLCHLRNYAQTWPENGRRCFQHPS